MFGLDGWNSLHNYLEDFLDKKLGLDYQSPDDQQSLIDLNKYEQALEEIEYNKTHKDARAKQLKTTLQKLKEYKKTDWTVKILTITTIEQDTIETLNKESIGKADFIICVPSDMTKTREPEAPSAMPPMPAAPSDAIPQEKPKEKPATEGAGGDDDDD